jgi:hypothetical protein
MHEASSRLLSFFLAYFSILKMEEDSTEMSLDFCSTKQHHIPIDSTLNIYTYMYSIRIVCVGVKVSLFELQNGEISLKW